MTESKPANRLDYFPITVFAAVLGLGGFTILLDKWRHLRWLPAWPYFTMTIAVTGLFLLATALYARKAIRSFPLVQEDYRHKTRANFVAAIPISILILSIIYMGCCPFASLALWYLGTVFQTLTMYNIFRRWVNHDFNITHFNPAWFIPVVGLVLIPVAGVEYVPEEVALFFWANGVVFWLVFFTIAMYRIIFHPPLPVKLAPTFFMLIAPPAVIFISYVRITMHFDFTAKLFFMIAVFMAVLLVFIKRQFSGKSFFMSWWAFTFPLDALAIAMSLAYMLTRATIYKYSAWVVSFAAAVAITIVGYQTLRGIIAGKICVLED